MTRCPICGCVMEQCLYPTYNGEDWYYCPTCDDYRLASEFLDAEHALLNADYDDDRATAEAVRASLY